MTPPKTPQLNGLAERMDKTLVERFKCVLSEAQLPNSFWAKALNTVAYVINLSVLLIWMVMFLTEFGLIRMFLMIT